MTGDTLLHIDHADLCYGAKPVLTGVTLSVASRDFLVLHGPNGGGKTTLLRLMAGLLAPTAGHVERRPALRIGYLPQYRSIDRQFPITVSDVVTSGLVGSKPLWQPFTGDHRRRTLAVMERLQIDSLARRPIDTLSGGQWQRTLLGRALVSDPELLLLDEPDTHLDTATKALLYDTLREEACRCAVVIVSHDATLGAHFPHCRTWQVDNGTALPEAEGLS